MGLVNLWARAFFHCCHLCSSSYWILLFITSAVALGAASEEAGSKSHPYPTFLGRGSQNEKDLDHPPCALVAKA